MVYIDESTFTIINNNYKTWLHPSEQIFFYYKDNSKINLLLAVSNKNLVYFKINDCNTKSDAFKNFIYELLYNLDESEKKDALFFIDNVIVHTLWI